MWLITKAFYIFIWISVTKEKYFVSVTKSKWSKEKDERCTFAKPPLKFSEEKVTTQLDGFDTTIDNVWVGYFRKNTGLENIGCVAETDIADNTSALTQSSKDPGYCFTICRKNGTSVIIGIFNTKCFCLRDDHILQINLTQPHCTFKCTAYTGVACGGVLGMEQFVSLYQLNYYVKNKGAQNDGSCLQFEPVNRYFELKSCLTDNLPVLCANDQNVFEIHEFKPWINATVNCFSNNSLPANYTASMKTALHEGSPLWTGVIRSYVIYDFDAKVPSQNDIEYGYLKRVESAYELNFVKKDESKHYLCVIDASTAKTTNSISTSLSVNDTTVVSSTVLSKSQTPSSSVSVSKTTMTTSHTDSEVTKDNTVEQTQSMRDSSVTVPVVVSVCVVFTIAISIAVIVILRRRGKIPDICRTKSTAHQTKYEPSVKKTTEGNQYEQVDDMISNSKIDRNTDVETDNTNYAHTYFVLENFEKQPEYEDAPGKHAKEMESSNVYNTLEQDVDKKTKQNKTKDSTYDTTKTVAEKLKSKFGEDSDAFRETDENLYNHTNSVPMKNNNTENVYNVTEDNENAYGDTDTNHENKAHGDDDTYNHI